MPPPAALADLGLAPSPSADGLAQPAMVPVEPTRAATTQAKPAATPTQAEDLPQSDPDLWVVSYGEDDDREMTEKEIAAELGRGAITLSTIVWHEGMPEWLPISGVKVLSKYAPTQKAAPVRQGKSVLGGKASPQPARSLSNPNPQSATATPIGGVTSATATAAGQRATAAASTSRQPQPAREKQQPSPQTQPNQPREKQASAPLIQPQPAREKQQPSPLAQPPQPREKLPSAPLISPKSAPQPKAPEPTPVQPVTGQKSRPGAPIARSAEPIPTEGKSKAAEGPPPLPRPKQKSIGLTADAAPEPAPAEQKLILPESDSDPSTAELSPAVSKPPALPRRGQPMQDTPAPWDQLADAVDDADEVVTSAPSVVDDLKLREPIQSPKQPAQASSPKAAAAQVAPAPSATRAFPTDRGSQQQRHAAMASARPPKPVETATSLVMRIEGTAGKDLLITDKEFLEMQRRFPKWALPVGILGVLVVVGLIVRAVSTSDELPPLPVVSAAPPSDVPRGNPADPSLPKHAQPNLDALPTSTAPKIDEKDFARLFAQSASKTNSTFDTKTAELGVRNVMELAARCRVAPDPSGQARVLLTFATAGQVVSVQVGSPYADTPTGKCIDKALRTVRVRPFQGEPGRLPVTVPIH